VFGAVTSTRQSFSSITLRVTVLLALIGVASCGFRSSRLTTAKSGYCPVCGMKVTSDGALTCRLFFSNNTELMFESPGDMIAFYLAPEKYSTNEPRPVDATIEKMLVKDYNTREILPAESATFVYKSSVSGPMGNDIFPFKTENDAAQFVSSSGGRIVTLPEVTPEMIDDLRR
jgi:copper chaperone NosL